MKQDDNNAIASPDMFTRGGGGGIPNAFPLGDKSGDYSAWTDVIKQTKVKTHSYAD